MDNQPDPLQPILDASATMLPGKPLDPALEGQYRQRADAGDIMAKDLLAALYHAREQARPLTPRDVLASIGTATSAARPKSPRDLGVPPTCPYPMHKQTPEQAEQLRHALVSMIQILLPVEAVCQHGHEHKADWVLILNSPMDPPPANIHGDTGEGTPMRCQLEVLGTMPPDISRRMDNGEIEGFDHHE